MRHTKFLILSLLFASSAWAQFTVVSGTVVDPNGLPYANGTITPILVTTATPVFTATGFGYTPPTQAVGLDLTGSFTMQLADNTTLSPAGIKWNFLVCSAVGTIQPAGGKGSVCFPLASPITISGASQSITANLNAVALALSASAQRPAILFGNCSGAATSGANGLGLDMLGGANGIATCGGNLAKRQYGIVLSHACLVKNLFVHVGTASITAGDGVMTVQQNASATALTCTLGTAASCSDTTHSFAGAAGDQIWIIGATNSTGIVDVSASMDCQ